MLVDQLWKIAMIEYSVLYMHGIKSVLSFTRSEIWVFNFAPEFRFNPWYCGSCAVYSWHEDGFPWSEEATRSCRSHCLPEVIHSLEKVLFLFLWCPRWHIIYFLLNNSRPERPSLLEWCKLRRHREDKSFVFSPYEPTRGWACLSWILFILSTK